MAAFFFFAGLMYTMADVAIDGQEVLKRLLKYVLEGVTVAIAAFFIPAKKLEADEVMMLALTAAATFALLDMFAPSIGVTARNGAGLGIGASLVGWPAYAGTGVFKP